MAVDDTGQVRVRALGYLGFTATDMDAWRTFATEVLGVQISEASTDEKLLLRVDEHAWRLAVRPGDGNLDYLGWEVADRADLEAMAARLDAAGVAVEDADPSERGVTGMFRTKDPAGNSVEIYYGAPVAKQPFVSPRGVSFVAGDMGVGHIVLAVPSRDEAAHFYIDLLGLRISDRINLGPVQGLFTHCNPRHHSLAMVEVPNRVGLNHFMLETTTFDAVGYAYDRVNAGAAQLTATMGKHTNDHMVSFYMRTPSNFDVEYGWNGRLIDDETWIPSLYNDASFWGHKRGTAMPPQPVPN